MLAYRSERLFQPKLHEQRWINMTKELSFRCQHCFSPLTSYLSKAPLKRDFWDIYLTTSLGVRKFKNRSTMRVFFFYRMFKIQSKCRKCKKKIWEHIFRFWDNCIWKCCYKLSPLRWEYMFQAVNGLTNRPKILQITKRDFFNQICIQRDR